MALNAAQIAARMGKLGGSDMKPLMDGDAKAIDKLWREKTGQAIPDDLEWVWQVQRGSYLEPLNIKFFEHNQKMRVSRMGDVVSHVRYDWAVCTLDGWVDELRCPIECKDCNGREPIEVIIDRYQPQMQWQMEVTGADQCALSVSIGNQEPVVDFIKRDKDYAAEMVKRGAVFIEHVRNGTPPVDLPAVPAPIDATAIYDMQGNNEFAHHADIWLQLRDSSAAYDDAAKILKSLVPADAKKCFGYGVQITRNRAGHLALREKAE